MRKRNRLTGAAAAAAMLLSAASPALARPGWGGDWRHHHRHHRGGGLDFGDVALGAVIIGGVAAVASAASRDRSRSHGRDVRYGDYDRSDRNPRGEQEAADRCSAAAEREGGAHARVGDVDYVARDGRGWRVEGVVDIGARNPRSFVCGVRDGRVDFVQLGNRLAWR